MIFVTKQIALILLLGMPVSFLTFATGYGKDKDGIAVSCYIGDPSDNRRVGEVSVFDVDKGRGNCNALYNRCEGDCTSCYRETGGREICNDRSGAWYYRWGFP
jgi:hypothetical protein